MKNLYMYDLIDAEGTVQDHRNVSASQQYLAEKHLRAELPEGWTIRLAEVVPDNQSGASADASPLALWDGGTSAWDTQGTTCRMICCDQAGGDGHDIVALVADEPLAQLFLTSPALLHCAEVLQAIADLPVSPLPVALRLRMSAALADLDFSRRMLPDK